MRKVALLFSNKKGLILLLIFILLITVIILLSSLILKPNSLINSNYSDLIFYLEKNNNEFIPKIKYENAINSLKTKNTNSKIQYNYLTLLAYDAQNAYFKNNLPQLRKYLEVLNKKVKIAFPTEHNDGDFLVGCADPECGGEPDPEELKLLKEVQSLQVDNLYKNVISTNLKISFYIPYDKREYKFEKINKIRLIHQQLLEINNANASDSAKRYAEYVKTKYKYDLDNPDVLPSDLK